MSEMDRGEEELSNGIEIMKIGASTKYVRFGIENGNSTPGLVSTSPGSYADYHYFGSVYWGMEVAVFDFPSPDDSNTGLGFILPSKLC
jgi:hypothetical protein